MSQMTFLTVILQSAIWFITHVEVYSKHASLVLLHHSNNNLQLTLLVNDFIVNSVPVCRTLSWLHPSFLTLSSWLN